MECYQSPDTVIRIYGCLRTLRRERVLPAGAELCLPPKGRAAGEIARELELPLERIEGIFCNHRAYELDRLLRPGDEIAFIPTGVPGPHRFILSIHEAGTGHLPG